MLQKMLDELGLDRKALRYNFTWKGKRYYVPTFNPLWWVISVVRLVVVLYVLYYVLVIFILLAP